MILFAINTGLRTGDIFNLQWREVDIEQQRLKKIVKKSEKPLSLPPNDTAFGIIEARKAVEHGPSVFYNPMTGGKFKDVKGALLAAVKRAGLPKITWHMFRHTFASRLTRDGVDIVTLKELWGTQTSAPRCGMPTPTMTPSGGRLAGSARVTKSWQCSHSGQRKQYNVVT
jgi:integrase